MKVTVQMNFGGGCIVPITFDSEDAPIRLEFTKEENRNLFNENNQSGLVLWIEKE